MTPGVWINKQTGEFLVVYFLDWATCVIDVGPRGRPPRTTRSILEHYEYLGAL